MPLLMPPRKGKVVVFFHAPACIFCRFPFNHHHTMTDYTTFGGKYRLEEEIANGGCGQYSRPIYVRCFLMV
jgi:hypothetical protein